MGELLRSEPMQLVQLFVQVEAAHDTVDELGKLGLIQFRDLNSEVSAFQRNFVNDVKKCDEMERKLKFFETQLNNEKREILEENNRNPEDLGLVVLPDISVDPKKLQVDELESKFDELDKELQQMISNHQMLTRNYNELIELKHVLNKDSAFFSEATDFRDENAEDVESKGLLTAVDKPEAAFQKTVKLGFVTGVIKRDKFNSFERVLWRSTRGNLFMKHAEIEEKIKDPQKGELVEKNVFIIFFQGERSQVKIKKICESFGANLYPCHDNARERRELLGQVNGRLEDLETVLKKSKKHRRQVLLDIGHNLKAWKEKVIKEKSIYHTMNMFNYDIGRRCLIAEGWCPKTATEKIVNAMRQATESSGALVPSILSVIQATEEPPTYFKTNKFTYIFQAIVEAYGVGHYREINPGVFTIITFPFLFAVMFGDLGHGFFLTLFAATLVLSEKKLGAMKLNELIASCFEGRYMLLLMGIFSMYTGLLYNEMFSVALDFGSNWRVPATPMFPPSWVKAGNVSMNIYMERIDGNTTYPFGVDPAWGGAPNSLNYYNSLKMKLSIILGVTQMTVGIILSAFNGIHFGHMVDVYFEFVPQLLFMLCLFGYLCFLIFFKWAAAIDYWGPVSGAPPFLLNTMIQMFLSPFNLKKEDTLYGGQQIVQPVLLIVAILCIPVMLLVKPLYLRHQNKAKLHRIPTNFEDQQHGHGHGHGDEEEFDFSEIFVKQCIHTIEYVLGAVSNTASYLRLWALSLAHSELSIVFWDRVLVFLFASTEGNVYMQVVAAWIGFGAWAGATAGVLLVMESLSAFLHALRLHWVEFQNKFYKGDGYPFAPFSYERIFSGEEAQ